jgi:hypothetical protein
MAPIRRELDRYRAASPLAAEILLPDVVQLLPAGADAGAWGAVTVARESLGRASLKSAPLDGASRDGATPGTSRKRREVGHA